MTEGGSEGLRVRLRQPGPIVLDVELECPPGQLAALVGPSGSGKTTILRSIAGLYGPREGRVSCAGEIWLDTARGTALRPQRRRVGLVFQDYALCPHLTALGNVALALGHLPRRERAARARELLSQVHLAGLENRRPAALSGGQQQRVAVARALARDPAALLLDEPFSAVDQLTRRRLQRELALLRESLRIPMLLVTHDLGEATALAERLYVLSHGRTLQHGPPGEVLARPRSALVARLVGHTNLFPGRILEVDRLAGRVRLDWEGHALEASLRDPLPAAEGVTWMVPASHVVLHRRDRPSRGERENPVAGVVEQLATLGETTAVTLRVEGAPTHSRLNFSLSTHAARRNGLTPGVRATVSLLADGIHLMPAEDSALEGEAP